jgi:cytidylate kinase
MAEFPVKIVAIDGGAASGKSSTARGVAARHGLMHVDTGSHYRFVTQHLLALGAQPVEDARLSAALARLSLGTRVEGNAASITIDGALPGDGIRSPEVNAQVSRFAALPTVRDFLRDYQRGQVAEAKRYGLPGLVMEGRDIGTVIFPKADLKVFLDADPATRAQRRAKEGVVDSIAARDAADATRAAAPLARAHDAVVIDSTHLTLEEVIERVSGLVSKLGWL